MKNSLDRLLQGQHHDPFSLLGWHMQADGCWLLRLFAPAAESLRLRDGTALERLPDTDLFELRTAERTEAHPLLEWRDKLNGAWHKVISPYTFPAQIGNLDLYLLAEGRHHHAWKILGSRLAVIDGISGCQFAVWAPATQRVSVVGDFNRWDGRSHPMRSRGESGVWELFIPGLEAGMAYKYEILGPHGQLVIKADPYAQQTFMRPETASCITASSRYGWNDSAWLGRRERFDWQHQPLSIYELHAGSWRRHADGGFYNWAELAAHLIPYVKELGYTHIELLPIAEYPLDESWGYQVSGYYAPTARFGSPDDFRAFVDACHQADIGVILDWVPAHFPRDDFALARFIGEPLYEHADPRRGEHQDWGTLIFDYGRNEVKNFLLANAIFWLEEFHVDGLRVDAVASMIYLDYSRRDGEWAPNQYGGRENLEAIAFLRELNTVVHGRFAGVLTIAEESTAWPMVSRPVELGGLGFSMKWNMGWMNDNLKYIEQDPVHRKFHHDQLTFSQIYSYTENFVLPLSHDEVVHLKGSMLDKMPGDYWQKFANLRLFYAWQYAHPGKKLLFMGGEFAQWNEWQVNGELDWMLRQFSAHEGIWRLTGDLNRLYRTEPALYQYDFSAQGFSWVNCHDSDQSVLSLLRHGDTEQIVVVLNFTPVPRLSYRIGVAQSGLYREILNSDSSYYGGSNSGNAGMIYSEPISWMGFAHSLSLTLPPLAAIYLKLKTE
ncbi:MAG TPA: 1,4-alpha-glucan branching protein GlgB [Burkholderiales bacterium]|nr:1,4-alpha-glucan branching protein GlgB [Burkholderiales bacterium]